MPEQALAGLKVIEFGNLVSAPYCGKLLADLGAEVIKVERPGLGDEARRREPYAGDEPGLERSGLFAYLNTNKLGVTLDVETVKGRDLFLELAARADVLVENNPPRRMKDLGLTYEALEKINQALIMTSITPFGQNGPHSDYKAYELNVYQGGGFGFISTTTIQEPVPTPIKAGGRQSQFAGGAAGAVASLTALFARDHLGEGQHVDISLQEVMAGQYEAVIEHWTFTQNEMGGVTIPIMMPIMPLPASDGWVFLMCVEDREFDAFVKVMGDPEWAKDELFSDRFKRAEYVDGLAVMLMEWSRQYTMEEIFQMAQAAGVPVGPAYTAEDVVRSPHLTERGYFVTIDHPVIGPAVYPGAPYTFSKTPWRIVRRAPLLGEHNLMIYHERLGYSRADIIRFAQAGVI
jgi:crotonobetainyl-CoA:carnitine CoA-transferase CaiB-like acyl-CoA transferase